MLNGSAARYAARADYWREVAGRTADENVRLIYLKLADTYDRLAHLFEMHSKCGGRSIH
jgi:hypothetical protein